MLKTLDIKGFRAFDSLRVEGLARVNLLVGRNNCGKTSVLEAVEMTSSVRNLSRLLGGVRRRGEVLVGDEDVWMTRPQRRSDVALDVRHIFHGHRIDGASAELTTVSSEGRRQVLRLSNELADRAGLSPERQRELFRNSPRLIEPDRLLVLRSLPGNADAVGSIDGVAIAAFPIGPSGELLADPEELASLGGEADKRPPIRMIPTSGWTGHELLRQWNLIAGTAAEDRVIKVMRLIEPRLARVIVLSPPRFMYDPSGAGGAFVRLEGEDDRIPLGTMGDGLRRLLVLGVALAGSEGGALLVDEIDTGLHYSALGALWQFVLEGARLLDVQVFATTHSADCVRALAGVVRSSHAGANDVCVQRIEAGPPSRAIAYSPDELTAAADRDIEIRGV